MLYIVALPFGVLIFAILIIGIARTIRKVNELQSRRSRAIIWPVKSRKPYDDFHDNLWLPLCQRAADVASAKLNRPLAKVERRTLWRSRSPLVLEVFCSEVESTASAEQVTVLLKSLPPGMNRPDPTRWIEG